jgi:hypothetical protein
MRYITATALVIAGLIHLLPLAGVLGPDRLASLYGIPVQEPNLAILMRHRAVLLGLMGALMIFAAFRPTIQSLVLVLALLTVISFLYLAWSTGGFNAQLSRVVTADIIALACLAIGAAAHAYTRWLVPTK